MLRGIIPESLSFLLNYLKLKLAFGTPPRSFESRMANTGILMKKINHDKLANKSEQITFVLIKWDGGFVQIECLGCWCQVQPDDRQGQGQNLGSFPHLRCS